MMDIIFKMLHCSNKTLIVDHFQQTMAIDLLFAQSEHLQF